MKKEQLAYGIYDQRVAYRHHLENGSIEYFMGGQWLRNEGLSKNWDTNGDPCSKEEMEAFIAARAKAV